MIARFAAQTAGNRWLNLLWNTSRQQVCPIFCAKSTPTRRRLLLRNIERILSNIGEFAAKEENPTLEAFLQQVSLASDIDEADSSANAVTLMTLHSAKGLEFPVVLIAGMEQGLFPLAKAENDPDEKTGRSAACSM